MNYILTAIILLTLAAKLFSAEKETSSGCSTYEIYGGITGPVTGISLPETRLANNNNGRGDFIIDNDLVTVNVFYYYPCNSVKPDYIDYKSDISPEQAFNFSGPEQFDFTNLLNHNSMNEHFDIFNFMQVPFLMTRS